MPTPRHAVRVQWTESNGLAIVRYSDETTSLSPDRLTLAEAEHLAKTLLGAGVVTTHARGTGVTDWSSLDSSVSAGT